VQAAIRRDALDEEIGQNGWLSAGEYRDLGSVKGANIGVAAHAAAW
jgi:hypothetical protein